MKKRFDFVSNSSSSSFIVKVEANIPQILISSDVFNFEYFCENFIRRDIIDPFLDLCSEYSCFHYNKHLSAKEKYELDVSKLIKVKSNTEYIKLYLENKIGNKLYLPEKCQCYINDLSSYINQIRQIKFLPRGSFYENGKPGSFNMYSIFHKKRYDLYSPLSNKCNNLLNSILADIVTLLKPYMNNWKFYYVELTDDTDAESRGYEAVNQTSWYRTFSNH